MLSEIAINGQQYKNVNPGEFKYYLGHKAIVVNVPDESERKIAILVKGNWEFASSYFEKTVLR